ncbi:MAG: hypothetical protein Q9162_003487 [Coniocarpon cinnabarinum]
MPDNLYFRQPETRQMLLNVLFVWSKINSDVSYRQGMHEILAPFLWAVERDAISAASIDGSAHNETAKIALTTFDAAYIEHDSFMLFTSLMKSLKPAYAATSSISRGHKYSRSLNAEPEIVVRSHRLLNECLAGSDPELSSYLISLEIQPQLFLMSWIRLLFGREFRFDECMELWDALFAQGADLHLIDLVCVAMILRLHWRIIDSDQNDVLHALLHYPSLPFGEHPISFVHDAKLLKSGLNAENGSAIVRKYSGKAPKPFAKGIEHQKTLKSGGSTDELENYVVASNLLKPPRLGHQPSNSFEAVVQNAARSVYSGGERLGLGKAVRDAVSDVQKNVQSIRSDIQDRTHSRNASSTSIFTRSQSSSGELQRRLDELTARNKTLAQMLEDAVTELWKRHQQLEQNDVDTSGDERAKEEAFTMAVAKVQLVQVYMTDLDLPILDETGAKPEHTVSPSLNSQISMSASTPADIGEQRDTSQIPINLASSPPQAWAGAEIEDTLLTSPTRLPETCMQSEKDAHTGTSNAQEIFNQSTAEQGVSPEPSKAAKAAPPRPSLEQSPFSWMLGQGSEGPGRSYTDNFPARISIRATNNRKKDQSHSAFLFGDPDMASDAKR